MQRGKMTKTELNKFIERNGLSVAQDILYNHSLLGRVGYWGKNYDGTYYIQFRGCLGTYESLKHAQYYLNKLVKERKQSLIHVRKLKLYKDFT